jgi:acylphosphatase
VHDIQQAKRYFVSGMVQGVGYRFFAQRAAEWLGVAGYVRNLRDGRVEVYAVGRPRALLELRAELERGPRGAEVSNVTEEQAEIDPEFARGFSVEYDR